MRVLLLPIIVVLAFATSPAGAWERDLSLERWNVSAIEGVDGDPATRSWFRLSPFEIDLRSRSTWRRPFDIGIGPVSPAPRFEAGSFASFRLAQERASASPTSAGGRPIGTDSSQTEDLETIGNKQINPISDLWSLVFQHDMTILDDDGDPFRDTEVSHNLKFQPVLPMELTYDVDMPSPKSQNDKGIRLITRPVFQLVDSRPIIGGDGDVDQQTEFGDILGVSVLGPARKEAGGFFYGIGATWGFPTATNDEIGSEKFIFGPAAVSFLFTKSWVLGLFPQHQFSVGGKGDRESINRTNVQYFVLYQVPNTQWKVGMTPDISVNWKRSTSEALTLPVGLGATTVVKIGSVPTRLLFEVQGFAARPDRATPLVNFRVLIAPVMTKPGWALAPIF